MQSRTISDNVGTVFAVAALVGAVAGWAGPLFGSILLGGVGVAANIWLNKEAIKQGIPKAESETAVVLESSIGRVHVLGGEIDWHLQMAEIRRAWESGDFDFARTWLQRLAYKITDKETPEEVHTKFKELMAAFAKDDPLYYNIMDAVLPAVQAEAGVLQSQLAKRFPQFEAEQFRYVLYYGEIIGDIVREKRGRSYSLFLPQDRRS